ncbi:MAG: type II secretion system protein N [Candidatus Sphingomonas phytovorans]|nr:type II secretion system protein N [Sphingomonas sp.]WEK01623.1 MAG: type II secretion system protein N [Sphingomonas sp.]
MRLVLDARARALLRRLPRTNVYSALELVLLAALALQCARLFWVLVTPVGALGPWQPVQPGFPGSPVALLQGFDPFFRLSGSADGKPVVVTSLQLTLFGTRVNEAMGGGSAIIAGPDGLQQSFAVGDEISPGVKLKAVVFDHVTIDRGGAAEDLFLDQSGAVTPVAPPPVEAGASLLPAPPNLPQPPNPPGPNLRAGLSPAQLRADIGFIPRVDGGKISGLVVRPQGSGVAFRQAGLREGDVITAINGRAVTGQGDMEQLGAQIGKGGTVPVTVERGNDTLSLTLTIAGQ